MACTSGRRGSLKYRRRGRASGKGKTSDQERAAGEAPWESHTTEKKKSGVIFNISYDFISPLFANFPRPLFLADKASRAFQKWLMLLSLGLGPSLTLGNCSLGDVGRKGTRRKKKKKSSPFFYARLFLFFSPCFFQARKFCDPRKNSLNRFSNANKSDITGQGIFPDVRPDRGEKAWFCDFIKAWFGLGSPGSHFKTPIKQLKQGI